MKNILKDPMESNAKVVDGKLILSFPGALRPVVWQMDFGHVKSSALEVQESGEHFTLTLKTPKGENVEIAPFETKQEAVKGLLAASKALENAQGKIRPAATSNDQNGETVATQPENKQKPKWLAPIMGILMLFILITVWASLSAPPPTTSLSGTNTNTQTGNAEAVGVPLSADDFLRAQ